MARRKSSGSTSESTANVGFEAKLWQTADKLRNNMDAAERQGDRRRLRRETCPLSLFMLQLSRIGNGASKNIGMEVQFGYHKK